VHRLCAGCIGIFSRAGGSAGGADYNTIKQIAHREVCFYLIEYKYS
jgi:hypothetical protein